MAINLSEPFIKRPVATILCVAGILLFGLIAWAVLPISDLPSVAYPTITVTANNPGSDAKTMAETIATPLEQQIMQIPGLTSVLSSSTQGVTLITVTFNLSRSPDGASTDVAAALNRAAGNLPKSMPTPPTYQRYNPSATPSIYMAVSSDTMTEGEMYDYANSALAQRISMVSGVSKVVVYGSPKAVRVKLNPDALAAMNLGIDHVATQVRDASQLLPAGQVYDQYQNFTLDPDGQWTDAEPYNKLIVAYRNGSPVRIEDVGEAVDSIQQENLKIHYWNDKEGEKPSVVLAITKEQGANAVKMSKIILNLLPRLEAMIPPSIDLNVVYDQAVGIKDGIHEVEFTLLLAFLLVVIVIFLFLGNLSSTCIPVVTLPLTIIGTFLIMYPLGYSIDLLSMLGLILVVGFLVDDAIVVLENIVRHMEMGKTPMQAALDGSKQISTTVLSMTLALCIVFVPFAFMPGIIGRMFHEFAMVVIISVLLSGVISLTLTPMMSSRILRRGREEGRFEKLANAIMSRLQGYYMPCLGWVLKHQWVPVTGAVVAFGLALLLGKMLPSDFIPPGDTGVVQGMSVAAQGVSPLAMNRYQDALMQIATENPWCESVVSASNIPNFQAPNEGIIFLNLKPYGKRPGITKVIKQVQDKFATVAGIKTYLRPFPEINLQVGTGQVRTDYTYVLSSIGHDEQLYDATAAFVAKLKELPELVQVSTDMQINDRQLKIKILRDRASTFGITLDNIERALGYAYAESRLNTFNSQTDIYWVIVEMEDKYRWDPDSLSKIWLTPDNFDQTGQLVPLSSVVEWEVGTGALTVAHTDQFLSTTIFFNLAPGAALGPAVDKINGIAEEVIPESISRQFIGMALVFKETMIALATFMVLGILGIYLLLGILYESFIHPLTILSALPGALFGALFMLFIFGQMISLYAYVGILVLIGIVMKNGIMLVEFANQEREEGKSPFDAIVTACHLRFRPILMTTVAAAMGAVPIALGIGASASSRRSLGLIILGGLLFAQLITYFFTPVVYLTFERMQQWIRNRRSL